MLDKISCVIPTYNRCPYNIEQKEHNPLWWCLTSLNQQTKAANLEEIVIVDDSSTDYTGKIVEQFQAETSLAIVYRKNEQRLGSGSSRNKGVELSQNGLLFFLDDDCIMLDPEILYTLNYTFDRMKRDYKTREHRIGALCPPVASGCLEAKIVPIADIGTIDREEGKMVSNSIKFPREYLADLERYCWDKERGAVEPIEVRFVSGVFLCDRDAFEEAGGFPAFPWRNAYAEEPELALNMQQLGWKIFYLPALDHRFRVFHCKFGYPDFKRCSGDSLESSLDGFLPLSPEGMLEESAQQRDNTGNRVDKYELLYSKIISDFWIMCKHVDIETGINSLVSKYKSLAGDYPGDESYLDLKDIPRRRRVQLWRQALLDGLRYLKSESLISSREEEYIKKVVGSRIGLKTRIRV